IFAKIAVHEKMSVGLGLCAICMSTLCSDNVAALHCGHTFHFECVSRWVESSNTCPICRVSTTPRQIIQHLYFTSANELEKHSEDPLMPPRYGMFADGPRKSSVWLEVHELTNALEEEKEICSMFKQKLLMLKSDVSCLQSMKMKEKDIEKSPLLEARIWQLEMMLVDQQRLETALERQRIDCVLVNYENAVDRFVREDGRVDVGQFVIMLRRQLDDARKVQKKLTSDLRFKKELVLLLREKEKKLRTIVKTLNQGLRDVRNAAPMNASSPFNQKLSSVALEQSPLKRDSLGINESVDIDTNVLSSALRSRPNGEPIRKRANATRVPNPQVPKSLRERVLKCCFL
ncbi:hypothetical protein KIN20_007950, partial [Parelaphostrongylus tenuis]